MDSLSIFVSLLVVEILLWMSVSGWFCCLGVLHVELFGRTFLLDLNKYLSFKWDRAVA